MKIGRIVIGIVAAVVLLVIGIYIGRQQGIEDYLGKGIAQAIADGKLDWAEKLVADLRELDKGDAEACAQRIGKEREKIAEEQRRKRAATSWTRRSKARGRRSPISSRSSRRGSSREAADIEAAAARSRAHVAGCYSLGLAQDPSLSGTVLVRFTVGPDGKVATAAVARTSLRNDAVEECLLNVVRTWTFGPRRQSQTLEYPFEFEPG